MKMKNMILKINLHLKSHPRNLQKNKVMQLEVEINNRDPNNNNNKERKRRNQPNQENKDKLNKNNSNKISRIPKRKVRKWRPNHQSRNSKVIMTLN